MSVKDGERAFRELQRLLRVYGAAAIVETEDYSGLTWCIYKVSEDWETHSVAWRMAGDEMGEIGHGDRMELKLIGGGFEVEMYTTYKFDDGAVITRCDGHILESWDSVERVRRMRADD